MLRRFALIVVVMSVVAGCANPPPGLPSDFYRTDVKRDDQGIAYIDRGSAFGVAIGTDQHASQGIVLQNNGVVLQNSSCNLPAGYKTTGVVYADDPALVNCISHTWSDRYWVNAPYYGNASIKITSHDGRVVRIEWSTFVSTSLI